MRTADFIVIGGGIAGAGVAYELAALGSVIVLERERSCGYHSTGRSAASFTENYGTEVIRRLAMGSRPFLSTPPHGFCEHPLLSPRGMLTIARADQLERMREDLDRARRLVPTIVALDRGDALARVPVLRPAYVAGAFFEPHCMEVDVDGLHRGYLRGAASRGAEIRVGAEVAAIAWRGGGWVVTPEGGESVSAPVLVNAAGAWADHIARLAGVAPLGFEPRRRTAFTIPAPEGVDIAGWPLVNDVGDEFYFKPDAGRLFVSPSDATPSEAVDAYAEDLDVATGVDRLERATTITVRRVSHSWAGLRTFAPDGSPVVGPDETAEGFVWLAGQGGYGIKTASALSRACVSLIEGRGLPDDLERLGLAATDLLPSPARRAAWPIAKEQTA